MGGGERATEAEIRPRSASRRKKTNAQSKITESKKEMFSRPRPVSKVIGFTLSNQIMTGGDHIGLYLLRYMYNTEELQNL